MKTALGVCIVLIAFSVDARDRRSRDNGFAPFLGATPSAPPIPIVADWEFLSASTPQGSVQDGCDYISAQGWLSGNYFCLRADGTQIGPDTLTENGSPATTTTSVCTNGVDCSSVSAKVMDGAATYWTTAVQNTDTGDQSGCAFFRYATRNASPQQLIAKDNNTGGRSFEFSFSGSSTVQMLLGLGGSSTLAGGNLEPGMWHLACFAYDFISSGANTCRLYIDGAQANAIVGSCPNIPNNTNAGYEVGRRTYASARNYFLGQLRLATRMPGKVMTLAEHQALNRVLKGTLTTSDASAITFVRGSPTWCPKSDFSTGSWQSADIPCVNGLGLQDGRGITNHAIASDAFNLSDWTKTNVSAVTGDTQTGLEQMLMAEALTSTVSGGYVQSTAAALASGNGVAGSVFARTTAGTQAMNLVVRNTTAAADVCTGSLTATTAFQRVQCGGASVAGNNYVIRIYPGSTAGTGTIVAQGAQLEDGRTIAGPYVRTDASSAAKSADAVSFNTPAAVTDAIGCVGADVYVFGTPASSRVIGYGATNYVGLNSATQAAVYDGTNLQLSGAAASVVNRSVRVVAEWNALEYRVRLDGQEAEGVFDGSLIDAVTYLGSNGGTNNFLDGYVKNVKYGHQLGACD